NPDLVIQTGHYSLMLDCDDMQLTGYDALAGSGYLKDLNRDVTVFTPAALTLSVTKDGVVYTCVGAAVQNPSNQLVRLIQSSRYVQRFDHLGLVFEDSGGGVLTEPGRFEVTAWSDRVALKLDFSGVAGVTETSVSVLSPGSVLHQSTVAGDSAVLAIQPHTDTTLSSWVPGDYINSAYDRNSLAALLYTFDPDEYALHIDVPAGPVSYPAETNRVDEYVIEITNPGVGAENIPLIFEQPTPRKITGTIMMLCEEDNGRPIGIPVQISKNWHKDAGNPTPHEGNWLRGYTMLNLDPGETRQFRLRVVYGYWADAGAVSHSQLSLIGWGKNWKWDESALGAWGESLTYDPTMHAGGAVMADIRPSFTTPMSGGTHNWTENSGGGDFLIYRDSTDTYRHVKRVKTAYRWVGPNMTEVLYAGITDDDKIRYTYTASAVRTLDYHRRFHRYKYEFLEEVVSPRRLVFHEMAAEYYHKTIYSNYYVGAGCGLLLSGTNSPGGDAYKGAPIPFNNRWLAIDDTISDDIYASSARRGLLSLASTLNGIRMPLYLHTYGTDYSTDDMVFDLSSDSVETSYEAGAIVEGEVEFIMPPKNTNVYWGSDAELIGRLGAHTSAWDAVYDEFRYNKEMDVTVNEGSLLRHYPLEIQASVTNPTVLAEVTFNGGGIGHVPILVRGVTPGDALHAQRFSGGAWLPIETADLTENNDYQAYLNVQGTMDAVFNIARPSLDLTENWSIRIVTGSANYAPVAYDANVTVVMDSSAPITLSGFDANGDSLTYTVVTSPANGALTGTAPNLTYTPDPGFAGADGFTFTVNDGMTDSPPATVSIAVAAQSHDVNNWDGHNIGTFATVWTVSAATNGNDVLYSWTRTGDLDGLGTDDTLSFDLRLRTYTGSSFDGTDVNLGTAYNVAGDTDLNPPNQHFGPNGDIDNNQSFQLSIENISYTQGEGLGWEAAFGGFTAISKYGGDSDYYVGAADAEVFLAQGDGDFPFTGPLDVLTVTSSGVNN
ncbi:MAG: Ig-like domain-containing protein, partial [Verrucomicrobiota bacterium]